nr:hypothetical protein [Microvirga brassicacearum]
MMADEVCHALKRPVPGWTEERVQEPCLLEAREGLIRLAQNRLQDADVCDLLGIVRIEIQGALVVLLGKVELPSVQVNPAQDAHSDGIIRCQGVGLLRRLEGTLQDRVGGIDVPELFELEIAEALGPDVFARECVEELAGDSELPAPSSHAAFEDELHA